jgi:hypothetical protein
LLAREQVKEDIECE